MHRLLGVSSQLLLWRSQELTQLTRAQQVPFRQVLRPATGGACDLTIFILLPQPGASGAHISEIYSEKKSGAVPKAPEAPKGPESSRGAPDIYDEFPDLSGKNNII